ncbi:MAG TPA: AzlD domain-containing protein [Gaiellaceae bacterium]|nr:AzlD domain-containing protein [Gaiellaceae bacterium]
MIRAAGPVALGRREPSERVSSVISLIAPALLAALVIYETVHTGSRGITIDARVGSLVAAAIALALRLPLIVVIVVAAAAAAGIRAVG